MSFQCPVRSCEINLDAFKKVHFDDYHDFTRCQWVNNEFGDLIEERRKEGDSVSDIVDILPHYLTDQVIYGTIKRFELDDGFRCPVDGCDEFLTKLQPLHFKSKHNHTPLDWVDFYHGDKIEELYLDGYGAYMIADKMDDYITRNIVPKVVNKRDIKRTREETMSNHNSMQKQEVVEEHFEGENNPAKDQEVRDKISEANKGMKPNPYSGRTDWYDLSQELDGYEKEDKIQGKLELKMARVLWENDVDFEVQVKMNYTVDFVVEGDTVIETKGSMWWPEDNSIKKGEEFMEQYPEYEYIVVGQSEETKKIPCDAWYPVNKIDQVVSGYPDLKAV